MLTRGILIPFLAAGTVLCVAGAAHAEYCFRWQFFPTGNLVVSNDHNGPSADFGGSATSTFYEYVPLKVQVQCPSPPPEPPTPPEPPKDAAAKWVAVPPSPVGIPGVKARTDSAITASSDNAFVTFSATDTCGAVGMVPASLGGNSCKSGKRPNGGGAFNTSATMGAVFYATFGSASHFGVKSGTHINFSPMLCDSESREGTGVALLTETPEKYIATHYACAPARTAQRF